MSGKGGFIGYKVDFCMEGVDGGEFEDYCTFRDSE